MENVTLKHKQLTEVTAGELGQETITVYVFHNKWNGEEVSNLFSEKQKEVADKIAEILKTIEL